MKHLKELFLPDRDYKASEVFAILGDASVNSELRDASDFRAWFYALAEEARRYEETAVHGISGQV